MKEVKEEEYTLFRDYHEANKSFVKVTEEFPDGSYSRIHYLGYSKRVKMCLKIFDAGMDKSFYYIY